MNQENPKATREMRAKRLRILRKMTCLTQKDFAEKHSVSFSNFQNWEGPRFGGLTETGAKKMLIGCKEEGIEASIEWLMYGIEPGPIVTEKFYSKNKSVKIPTTVALVNESYFIENELLLFEQNYQQQILTMIIKDKNMEPKYSIGETVAGKRFFGDSILELIKKDCIIELQDGTLMLRKIKSSEKNGLFHLICNNPHTTDELVICDAKIISAAPVMWIRRPLNLF